MEALTTQTLSTSSYRQKILKEKAVPMIEGYMFEEHEMIRRAATECMCNLAMSKEVRPGLAGPHDRDADGLVPGGMVLVSVLLQVQDLFEAQGNDRLKLLVLYSGEEDELLRRAAAGGLAMLTSMRPSLCSRIPQVVSACPWQGRGRKPAAPCMVVIATLWGSCFLLGLHPPLFPTDHTLAGDLAVPASKPQPGAATPGHSGGAEHGGGLEGDCQHPDGE